MMKYGEILKDNYSGNNRFRNTDPTSNLVGTTEKWFFSVISLRLGAFGLANFLKVQQIFRIDLKEQKFRLQRTTISFSQKKERFNFNNNSKI